MRTPVVALLILTAPALAAQAPESARAAESDAPGTSLIIAGGPVGGSGGGSPSYTASVGVLRGRAASPFALRLDLSAWVAPRRTFGSPATGSVSTRRGRGAAADLSVVYRFRPTSRLSPYLLSGAGIELARGRSSVRCYPADAEPCASLPYTSSEFSDTVFPLQLGAGIEFPLGSRRGLVEGRYFSSGRRVGPTGHAGSFGLSVGMRF